MDIAYQIRTLLKTSKAHTHCLEVTNRAGKLPVFIIHTTSDLDFTQACLTPFKRHARSRRDSPKERPKKNTSEDTSDNKSEENREEIATIMEADIAESKN